MVIDAAPARFSSAERAAEPNHDMTTWRELLAVRMDMLGDSGPVVAYAPSEAAFDVAFDSGFGEIEGPAVLAWTDTHVFFPVSCEGAEWMGSAPRHPVAEGQPHVTA